jgi:hypothetical protein
MILWIHPLKHESQLWDLYESTDDGISCDYGNDVQDISCRLMTLGSFDNLLLQQGLVLVYSSQSRKSL